MLLTTALRTAPLVVIARASYLKIISARNYYPRQCLCANITGNVGLSHGAVLYLPTLNWCVSDLPIAARDIISRGVYRPKRDTGGVSWQPEAETWIMDVEAVLWIQRMIMVASAYESGCKSCIY